MCRAVCARHQLSPEESWFSGSQKYSKNYFQVTKILRQLFTEFCKEGICSYRDNFEQFSGSQKYSKNYFQVTKILRESVTEFSKKGIFSYRDDFEKCSHRDFCNIVCPAAMCGGHHGSLKRIYINNIWLYTWLIFVTQLVVMMVATYIRCEKHLMKLKLNLVTSL